MSPRPQHRLVREHGADVQPCNFVVENAVVVFTGFNRVRLSGRQYYVCTAERDVQLHVGLVLDMELGPRIKRRVADEHRDCDYKQG